MAATCRWTSTPAGRSCLCLGVVTLALGAGGTQAQLVTPKTVPVHQSDQFDILPSARGGMASLWIALDDTLLDPFVSPAKVTRHRVGSFFALPFFHSISGGRGGGKTVPVGGFFSAGDWSGAATVAIQQLNRANVGFGTPISDRAATNQYINGVLGRRFGQGVSLGASAYWAGLAAIDGVDLLYAGSDTIRQDGSLTDLRLGLTKAWEGDRTLELVVVHNRTSMVHDVHTTTFGFDSTRRIWGPLRSAWDHNADRTNIWGLHTEYVRPFGNEGWRVGWLATGNRISHPKIPNYRLMNIPRDPGFTNAFNAGVGFAKVKGLTTVGVDLIYEPMFSNTWADAARDTARAGGGVIPAGGKTVENDFRFANSKLRIGIGREHRHKRDSSVVSGFQFGLAVGSVSYRLKQRNNVLGTFRIQDESWMEWAPTFGWHYRSRDIEFFYTLRMTCLSGSACVPMPVAGGDDVSVAPPAPGGVIAAPSAPLTFDGGRAVIHRFSISIPIR
ncbi:MAG: hypothetical protein ACT4P7_04775 [Gemmatimonadaceae bacterium]